MIVCTCTVKHVGAQTVWYPKCMSGMVNTDEIIWSSCVTGSDSRIFSVVATPQTTLLG